MGTFLTRVVDGLAEKYSPQDHFEKEEKSNCEVEQILQKASQDQKGKSKTISLTFDGNKTKRKRNSERKSEDKGGAMRRVTTKVAIKKTKKKSRKAGESFKLITTITKDSAETEGKF